jgi:hypothetical protein
VRYCRLELFNKKGEKMENKHPVPKQYHRLFAIGQIDRRGNVIDFKSPLIIIDSLLPISEYKKLVLNAHIDAMSLPQNHVKTRKFMVLRPTALQYRGYVKKELQKFGLPVEEEFELNNFMKFADIIYSLNPRISFHWKWRIIMRALHDTGTQNQNKAVVFVFGNQKSALDITKIKRHIHTNLGETPVLIRHAGIPKIALGIHHLHSPDPQRLIIEYNVLMHAKNTTSVFANPD